MSTVPLTTISEYSTSTKSLQYVSQSPILTSDIKFGTAEYIEPIVTRPLQMDDDKMSDECILLSPTEPKIVIDAPPQLLQIKVEEFEEKHSEKEEEVKNPTFDAAALKSGRYTDAVKAAKRNFAKKVNDITSVPNALAFLDE